MRYRLTERWPTVSDAFVITDESGRPVYEVRSALLSFRETLTIREAAGGEVGKLVGGWLGSGFRVIVRGGEVATVRGGRRPRIELLEGRGRVTVQGRIAGREYTLSLGNQILGTVSRKFFSLTDAYGVEATEPADSLLVLALATALHRLSQAG